MLVSDIKVLSAEDIATALDRAEQTLEIPEWGGAIKLKALSQAQRNAMLAACMVDGKVDQMRLMTQLCVAGVAEPLLTEALLAERSFAVVDRIASAVLELSGMGKGAALTATRTF
jgi:Asp/Glu/hydantoin racemase